jgi:rubrerythrin
MEHIGSRKILLNQDNGAWPDEALRHMAEEARHAHFFRRAAEKISGQAMTYSSDSTLARPAAVMYMQRLDATISSLLDMHKTYTYGYVTLAVEIRADWLYEIYESVLKQADSPISLRSVIAEEEAHLAQIEEFLKNSDANFNRRRSEFEMVERKLFARWFEAMKKSAVSINPNN